jgi:oligopeptide/dipeptide ABC transporter ATP-binding protein
MVEPLLKVENLTTAFKSTNGFVKAIDGVSFTVAPGEITGIVGESGCGKSVTMQSVMQLYEEKGNLVRYSGKILFNGINLLNIPDKDMRKIRGRDISMVFQDALSALNPVYSIGEQLDEALRIHTDHSKEERLALTKKLLELVGINEPEKRLKQYPHEISGGMRQRVMIAIALACHPKLLIADEPTTALDVTIQAQILDLLKSLNKKLGMSIILITHDMSVIAQNCQNVIVMYLGQVVEKAEVCDLFDHPSHPYTRGLINSIPKIEGEKPKRLFMIRGNVPLLSQIPHGCRFAPRCPYATAKCKSEMPELKNLGNNHFVRCWYAVVEGNYD